MDRYKGTVNGKVIAEDIKVAYNFFQRLIGLLGHRSLKDSEALLICACKQVHTFGMRFDIDIAFLSLDGEVLHIEKDVSKNKISKYIQNAVCVLELKAGTIERMKIRRGDIVLFELL